MTNEENLKLICEKIISNEIKGNKENIDQVKELATMIMNNPLYFCSMAQLLGILAVMDKNCDKIIYEIQTELMINIILNNFDKYRK